MSWLFQDAECFRVIVADPPWAYGNFGQAKHGAARAAYGDESELMPVDEIAELPVQKWAADDSVLFLWTTWPHLDDGLEVLRRWGFRFVTGFPWLKVIASTAQLDCGIGFWTQSASEIVLVGRAGALAREDDAPRVRGLLVGDEMQFYAPTGSRHSEKPYAFRQWIEETVRGPYLEIFAREEHAGWTTWGHELGQHLSPKGVEAWSQPVKA